MKKTFKQRWELPPTWLKILVIILLILGVFFRFANLEKRAYWHDETYTLLRISGYTVPEVTEQVFNGRVIGVEELRQYQSVNLEKNVIGTINGLVKEDQHHPPIYFVMARFWNQWFGNSLTINRSLTVLISLLVLPFIYWLCLELFQSHLTAWIAVGLASVSPFHIHYAQEIREYGLWAVTTLLMSVSLLRAMRLGTKSAWMIYALTTVVALYSAVFSVFVVLGHGIYVAATEGFRLTRKFITYLITSFIALIAFLPWILVILTHLDKIREVTSWMDMSLPVKDLVKRWIFNLQSVFFETNFWLPSSLKTLLALAMTLLVGYSIYVLSRRASKEIWLFIVTLIVPISLFLILPDLISGGIRSTNARYFVPSYLGSQLAVAYLLSLGFSLTKIKFGLQRQLRILTVTLMAAGILSGVIQAVNPRIIEDQQMAKIINQADMPLVVSGEVSYNGGGTFGDIMVMSHLLDPKVKLQLIIEPNVPEIPAEFKDIFLYKIPESVKRELENKYTIKSAYLNKLWYLERSA
ncbi:MAG: glycosyltransferase family 39 protein [Nostocales cyanobacterium 94392]|nr:glycosyltransferase family 39 protein [Nostocales cyanobacterium 94392]